VAVWMASNASASALIASGVSAPGRAAHTWCEEQQAVEHGMQKDGRQVGAPHGPRIVRRKLRFQVWAGLKANGRAGAWTFAALRAPVPRSPLVLSVPV